MDEDVASGRLASHPRKSDIYINKRRENKSKERKEERGLLDDDDVCLIFFCDVIDVDQKGGVLSFEKTRTSLRMAPGREEPAASRTLYSLGFCASYKLLFTGGDSSNENPWASPIDNKELESAVRDCTLPINEIKQSPPMLLSANNCKYHRLFLTRITRTYRIETIILMERSIFNLYLASCIFTRPNNGGKEDKEDSLGVPTELHVK